ncbi:myc box-dependent-interacting protein 1-like isoform X2 [Ptychodera flava]|uniref:myc box-dependent-interacting protein 1-like isoform X2 n=1 Tax=Ptychodera flava TaxID=63121 RepID=UPI00396AA41C
MPNQYAHAPSVKSFKMAEGGKRQSFLSKNFTKQASRAKERMLRTLGKADETKDKNFDNYVQNFNRQQAAASKLQKEITRYIQCVKAMSAASKSLYGFLREVYEEDWEGYNELNDAAENGEFLWDDYQNRLSEQVYNPVATYTNSFSDVKGRISKRGRKLVDYDSARHNLEAMQNNPKKKDEGKSQKVQEAFYDAKRMYEDLHNELLEELPSLYDSRIPLYANTFQITFSAESTFHGELSKVKNQLNDIMDKLAQAAANGTYNVGRPSSQDSDSYNSQPSPQLPSTPEQRSSLAKVYNVALPNDESTSQQEQRAASNQVLSAPSATPEDDTEYTTPPQTVQNGDEFKGRDRSGTYETVEIGAQLQSDDLYSVPTSNLPAKPAAAEQPAVAVPLSTTAPSQPEEQLPPGTLYKVQATHKYDCMDTDELSFDKGEIIYVIPFEDLDDQEDGWLYGICASNSAKGMFPENFTRKV